MLTPTTLNYLCLTHGDQRGFQFEIIINAFSALFEHLCYGTTAIINILILSVRGPSLYVRICRLYTSGSAVFICQDLTSDPDV